MKNWRRYSKLTVRKYSSGTGSGRALERTPGCSVFEHWPEQYCLNNPASHDREEDLDHILPCTVLTKVDENSPFASWEKRSRGTAEKMRGRERLTTKGTRVVRVQGRPTKGVGKEQNKNSDLFEREITLYRCKLVRKPARGGDLGPEGTVTGIEERGIAVSSVCCLESLHNLIVMITIVSSTNYVQGFEFLS